MCYSERSLNIVKLIFRFFTMNNSQLDLNLLSGYLTNLGKDTLNKMLNLYIEQSNVYLQDIKHALDESSQSLWQEHCHKMKGASASVGCSSVNGLLITMEKSIEDENIKRKNLQQLKLLNQTAITEFEQWLAAIG